MIKDFISFFTKSTNFFLLSGPCVVESEIMTLKTAEKLKEITEFYNIPFVFKSSFKKANRSRLDSFTGIGDEKALKILDKVRQDLQIPVVTDIHTQIDIDLASQYVDILQIPAFLVRQTDLLVYAAKTNKIVNLKKGQFMSPSSMKHAVNKVIKSGNNKVLLTDRGTMFGYNDLIVDYRGIPEMQKFAPTILDITHSLQQPNTELGITGGLPHLIETIAKAGIATGVNGLFMETHPNPYEAKSDGANMIALDKVEILLKKLCILKKALNQIG